MAKIPVRGMNPALKKVREKAAKEIAQKTNREAGIKMVRETMKETLESTKPVKEFINDTLTGLPSQRGGNAKMSGPKTFNRLFNSDASLLQQESIIRDNKHFFDSKKRDNLISKNRARSQQLRENVGNLKPENLEKFVNSNGGNSNNATGAGNKAKRRIEQLQAEKAASKIPKESRPTTKMENNSTIRTEEATAGSRKYLTKSNIQKGVGLGVGGYLVLNMFNSGGQMSNADLYSQQQQYGY